ncbi:hypothetical protein AHAS_Ahas02G0181900 [Arachis hypogaea]
MKQALCLVGLIDASDRYVAGSATVVQVDDVLDRAAMSTRFLSQNATILVVGDSVFVHRGLLPQRISYGLERTNEDFRDYIKNYGFGLDFRRNN